MTDTPHEWYQDKRLLMYEDDRGFRCRSPEHADCDAELSYEAVLKRLQATDVLSAEVSRRADVIALEAKVTELIGILIDQIELGPEGKEKRNE